MCVPHYVFIITLLSCPSTIGGRRRCAHCADCEESATTNRVSRFTFTWIPILTTSHQNISHCISRLFIGADVEDTKWNHHLQEYVPIALAIRGRELARAHHIEKTYIYTSIIYLGRRQYPIKYYRLRISSYPERSNELIRFRSNLQYTLSEEATKLLESYIIIPVCSKLFRQPFTDKERGHIYQTNRISRRTRVTLTAVRFPTEKGFLPFRDPYPIHSTDPLKWSTNTAVAQAIILIINPLLTHILPPIVKAGRVSGKPLQTQIHIAPIVLIRHEDL